VLAALGALVFLSERLLADRGASSGRTRRTLGRCARAEAGQPLDDEDLDAVGSGPDDGLPQHLRRAPSPEAAARRRQLTDEQLRAARIEHSVEKGGPLQRARKKIRDPGLADTTDAGVRQSLQDKHPQRPLPQVLETEEPAAQATAEQFNEALAQLERNRGAAAGPSGMTCEHLLAAAAASDAARDGLLQVVNLILSGKLPHSDALLDSLLIGIAKPDGTARPIAIGEALYRLVGQVVLVMLDGIGAELSPQQLGVGIPDGVQAAGLAVRAALAEDPEAMALSLDIENCFNSLSRDEMFAGWKRFAPGLLPFVQYGYAKATNLHIVGAPPGTPPIQSTSGCKQGDKISMVSAGFTLKPRQEAMAAASPALLQFAVADDITLVGRTDTLRAAWQCATSDAEGFARARLCMQPLKTALTGGDREVAAQLAAELGVPHKPEGIVIAGTPVGTEAFMAEVVHKRAASIVADVEKLMQLPVCKQVQWLLLRCSLSRQMAHLMRVVPWAQLGAGMRRVEQALLRAAACVFKLPAGEGPGSGLVNAQVATQLSLPARLGGFGLRTASATEAGAALLACAARAQKALAAAPEDAQPLRGEARASALAAWHGVYDDIAAMCAWPEDARDLPPAFERNRAPLLQREIGRAVADREAAELLSWTPSNDAPLPERKTAARLRSAAGGPASALWITPRASPPLRVGNDAFVMAGRHRLGLGPVVQSGRAPCPCGVGAAAQPDHAMVCSLAEKTIRHNYLVSAWRGIMRAAGCASSREPPYNGVAGPGAGQKRGDICAVLSADRMVVADVVVADPCCATALARGAARTTGKAAAVAAKAKHEDLGGLALADGNDFVALAHESHGRMGKEALKLLQDLGEVAASNGRVSKRAFVLAALCKLSVALAKGNGRMYTTACFTVSRALGHDYVPGDAVPTADLHAE
jgi:hypothetical protein